jgi:integrase
MAKPFYKTSHKAWYLRVKGKTIRLGQTEEEALAAYRQLCLPCTKLHDLVKRFIEYHESVSATGTVAFYERPLESFMAHVPCDLIADIRPHHVTAWLTGVSGATFRHNQMRAIKACFAWGVKEGLIAESPLHRMSLPTPESRGDETYLTKSQWNSIQALAEAANDNSSLLDLLLLLKHTGCRPQEARTVEARHLIDRCLIFPKAESKGKSTQRVIHLDDVAYDICRRLALKHPAGPLFRNAHGNPWTPKLLDARCSALSERLGFSFTPYSLRHTFATDAIVAGVDLQTIATLMGHRDLKMLSRVYQHVQRRSEHLRDSLQRITA